ncbi:hypothetical protein ACFY3U_27250 [Micromonospora sp. NPDC000089]|uniref:COG4315 family predicted lipoprotein n=1 Tax=unclassified Micromonospora TaxID=2617518 RepID=UPI0036A7B7F5
MTGRTGAHSASERDTLPIEEMTVKKLLALVALSSAVLGLTACGSSQDSASKPAASASAAPSASDAGDDVAPVPTPTVRPEQISLAVHRLNVKGVTSDVVTINGMTAYRFEVDDNKPSHVNCLNDCLITWPPALSDGSEIKVSGIDRSLVGTVKREDGYEQVTLAGWPLYRFVEDKVPTDTEGEGVGGNWSVVKPDGKPVIKKS